MSLMYILARAAYKVEISYFWVRGEISKLTQPDHSTSHSFELKLL